MSRTTPRDDASGRRPRRRRPIRLRITALLLVPLVSLITLWAFAANITLGDAFDKYDFSTTYEKVGLPGIYLVNQLQAERSLSVVALSTRDPADRQKLGGQRARVSAVDKAFRSTALSPDARDAAEPETKRRLAEAVRALDRLPQLRARVDSGRVQPLEVINSYSVLLDQVIKVFDGLVTVNDVAIFTQGRALIGIGNARAYMLREDSLVTAAMARNGRLTAAEHTAFVQWAAEGRRVFEAGLADLNERIRGPLGRLAASPEFQRYRAAEDAIVGARGDRLPPEAADWQATTQLLSQAWAQKVTEASLALNEMAKPIGERIIMRLVLAGGFGLLAVIASILLSLLAARSLSRELRGLQRAALKLAEDRLPGVVARLRRGEEVDVDAEAPPLVIGKSREVARVGDAFTKVQHTAIETAVRESYLRQGISRVFLNVAWRSQSLLHRQLRMLDEMERDASDPKVLEDLFRLDHLTTRMRRHAEGLVILSGTSPGRGWSRPVHVEDVLRAAVAEVEDYTRVEIVVVSGQAAVIGEAVADIIHLLAELIENATVFSPAPTEVLVRGEMGANGFAVDIIDRGIGLDQSELDALNLRLARPPEFDLAVTDRLGLFVVGRLAGRHGIRVALQPSLYGGVSAVVLIPRQLIVDADQPEDEDGAVQAGPVQQRGAAVNGSMRAWPTPPTPSSTATLNAPVYDIAPVQDVASTDTAPNRAIPGSPAPNGAAPDAMGPAGEAAPPETPVSFPHWGSEEKPDQNAAVGFDDGDQTPTSFGTPPPHGPPPTDATRPFQAAGPRAPAFGGGSYGGAADRYGAPASFGETPFGESPFGGTQFGDAQTTGGGRAPLPRRVRGGSLAPQLRDAGTYEDTGSYQETGPYGEESAATGDAIAAWEERSAEASRDLFASLQAGWLRGRDEDEAPEGPGMEGRS
ncbi:nitrate- and nitrite sensing domain-containing protein [Actinomadura luteofluorescens]|uniref:nitrate- and nitrite sensing domain-containing protein n=1 Tax=Actinomadura luteofluorescens TaxID=46163 RepID=UPI002164B474|nr:nitrate- and nitrite sensing domain-containing protein [Actinomadura glauciflava]MCR3740541.1 Signal transduction histidine kinase [Actinomadura glauciflava]